MRKRIPFSFLLRFLLDFVTAWYIYYRDLYLLKTGWHWTESFCSYDWIIALSVEWNFRYHHVEVLASFHKRWKKMKEINEQISDDTNSWSHNVICTATIRYRRFSFYFCNEEALLIVMNRWKDHHPIYI